MNFVARGQRVLDVGQGDNNVINSKHGGVDADFAAWKAAFWQASVKIFSKSAM